MQIAEVESLLLNGAHFVRITTDQGQVGLGQSACWAYPTAVDAVVQTFKGYLTGKDPRQIERILKGLVVVHPRLARLRRRKEGAPCPESYALGQNLVRSHLDDGQAPDSDNAFLAVEKRPASRRVPSQPGQWTRRMRPRCRLPYGLGDG